MRILVFFDLPVTTREQRKIYSKFHKFLVSDGYDMLQFSVYCRICNGSDAVEKFEKRLRVHLPPTGSVRFLQLTDKQYANMKFLVGKPTLKEKKIGSTQLNLF